MGESSAGFGRRVRQRREALGLSQAQLAEQAQLSAGTISMIENGLQEEVSTRTARQLARALLCGLDWLLRPFDEDQRCPVGVGMRRGSCTATGR